MRVFMQISLLLSRLPSLCVKKYSFILLLTFLAVSIFPFGKQLFWCVWFCSRSSQTGFCSCKLNFTLFQILFGLTFTNGCHRNYALLPWFFGSSGDLLVRWMAVLMQHDWRQFLPSLHEEEAARRRRSKQKII